MCIRWQVFFFKRISFSSHEFVCLARLGYGVRGRRLGLIFGYVIEDRQTNRVTSADSMYLK